MCKSTSDGNTCPHQQNGTGGNSGPAVGPLDAQAGGELPPATYLESTKKSSDEPPSPFKHDPFAAANWDPKAPVVEEVRETLVAVPCRCACRYCDTCCVGMGLRLREQVLKVLRTFKGLQMWTLTLDPTLFDSPAQALDYVRRNALIGRWVRDLKAKGVLHSGRYFAVIEYQKNGMPHWHILLDTTFVPFWLATSIWNRFRPADLPPPTGERPGLGSLRFSRSKQRFNSPEHAANYACKYVIKHPEQGYPDWLLDLKNVQRYSVSKGFWNRPPKPRPATEVHYTTAMQSHDATCFCPVCRGDAPDIPYPAEVRGKRKSRTIREQLSQCRKTCVLLTVRTVTKTDGTIQQEHRYERTIPVSFADMLEQFELPDTIKRIAVTPAMLSTIPPWPADYPKPASELTIPSQAEPAPPWPLDYPKLSQEERDSLPW